MRRTFVYLMVSAILGAQGCAQRSATAQFAPPVLGALYNFAGFQSDLDVASSWDARLRAPRMIELKATAG